MMRLETLATRIAEGCRGIALGSALSAESYCCRRCRGRGAEGRRVYPRSQRLLVLLMLNAT